MKNEACNGQSSCEYCKSGLPTRISHVLWTHILTVDDYQDLIERGWRRAGYFIYKDEMETTCCPTYTIRLKADDFVPSKEQLRVSRRMQRYLDGMLYVRKHEDVLNKSSALEGCTNSRLSASSKTESLGVNSEVKNKEEEFMNYLSEQINNSVRTCIQNGDLPWGIQLQRDLIKKVSQTKRKRLAEGSEDLLYTSNVSFWIAANLRQAKKAGNDSLDLGSSKSDAEGNMTSLQPSPKLIAEKLASYCQLVEIRELSVRACNGHINFYSATKQNSLDKERPSAMLSNKTPIQHESKGEDVTFEQSQVKKRRLEIHLKRSSFDPEEFALYKKYQLKVHNDTPDHVTKSSYMRFLVDTPLVYAPPTGDGTVPPSGFGSFHQQYVVDGQLVAVGVIDILPKCLSGNYLFWDPDLAFLSLGKYSALQEIGWVKDNKCFCPSLQYYYLGYYVHSCSKMRYKAAYKPSELLCPLRCEWVPFSLAKPVLDRKKYAILSDSSSSQNAELLLQQEPGILTELQQDNPGNEDLNDIGVKEHEEIVASHFESSCDKSIPETNDLKSAETEDSDVGNVLIDLKGSRVKYEDLCRAIGPVERSCLENKLSRYVKVVGAELSERMVYMIT
ncbi:hypothetical protein Ancab_034466 [Ancistrocladus abbreviatus]